MVDAVEFNIVSPELGNYIDTFSKFWYFKKLKLLKLWAAKVGQQRI